MTKETSARLSPLDELAADEAPPRPNRQVRWPIEDDGTVNLARPPKPPRTARLEADPQNVIIDLAKSAIIVVDMQNDFFRDDGWFGLRGVDLSPLFAAIEPINGVLPPLRAAGVPVVWVSWGVRPDGLGLPPNVLHAGNPTGRGLGMGDVHPAKGYNILARGSWGAAVIDEMDTEDGDVRVDKVRISGFWDSELDGVLRHMGVTTLLFTGVNLDRCVMATLEDAAYLGYDCLVVDDCTATVHPEFATQHCHLMIKQLFGFITNSEAIFAGLAAMGGGS